MGKTMPKAVLRFKLPEEQSEFNSALKGGNFKSVLWELDQWLRGKLKYPAEDAPQVVLDAYQEMRTKLNELAADHDAVFDEG